MSKQIVFVSDSHFNFYSSAPAIDVRPGLSLLVTRTNQLVFRRPKSEKQTIALSKSIEFEKKEWVKLAQILSETQVLLVTSKLRVFLLEVDWENRSVEKAEEISFRYGSNLNGLNSNLKWVQNDQLCLFVADHLIFHFDKPSKSFRIFKVLNEPALDLIFSQSNHLELYVLTTKRVLLFKANFARGGWNSQQLSQTPIEALSVSPVGDTLAVLLKDNSIAFWQRKDFELTKPTKFVLGPKKFEPLYLATVDGTLAIISKEYLFLFGKDRDHFESVLSLKPFNFLSIEGRVFDLQNKTENAQTLGLVQAAHYSEDNMNERFMTFSMEDRLSLLLSYLCKKFLEKKKIENYNAVIQDMLYDLNLQSAITKHPKFAENIKKLFGLIKDFTSMDSRIKKGSMSVVCPSTEGFAKASPPPISEKELFQKMKPPLSPVEVRFVKAKMRAMPCMSAIPSENAQIKFIRAANQLMRWNRGLPIILALYRNESIHKNDKVLGLCFYANYFRIEEVQLIMFGFLSALNARIVFGKANSILNGDPGREDGEK